MNETKGDCSMLKFAVGALTALVLFVATTGGASAVASAGPYDGKFHGRVSSDNGTSAPLSVNITRRGDTVAGTASLGEGLVVETSFCGTAALPATTRQLSGHTQA